jgi:hypothetical protein
MESKVPLQNFVRNKNANNVTNDIISSFKLVCLSAYLCHSSKRIGV